MLISSPGVRYIKLYGLNDVKTCIRGTLRYKGFCEIVRGIMEIGFFRKDPIEVAKTKEGHATFFDILSALVDAKKVEDRHNITEDLVTPVFEDITLPKEHHAIAHKAMVVMLNNHNYNILNDVMIAAMTKRIIKAFRSLGFFDESKPVRIEGKTYFDVMTDLLSQKLKYLVSQVDSLTKTEPRIAWRARRSCHDTFLQDGASQWQEE